MPSALDSVLNESKYYLPPRAIPKIDEAYKYIRAIGTGFQVHPCNKKSKYIRAIRNPNVGCRPH